MNPSALPPATRPLPVPGRWCIHAYYTLSPWAPDGSDRVLAAGVDLDRSVGEVLVLTPAGDVLDRFGETPVIPSIWHTGLWQSWSPDARFVYFQSGTIQRPQTVRRELAMGREVAVAADIEGMPPDGEPALSCPHGMLYAAGYGDGRYKPEVSPFPFAARDRHGIFEVSFDPPGARLALSTAEIFERHPQRDRLRAAERDYRARHGAGEGLTLMTYCIRWSPHGDRFLFYFGNHCVAKERGEPRIGYVFTADRSLRDLYLAVDLSFGRPGVHWGWQPDGEHLIGYGPLPDGTPGRCLAGVRFDGTEYRMLSARGGSGHPSVSPTDPNLVVTDLHGEAPGRVAFLDLHSDRVVAEWPLPRIAGESETPGRNPLRVCHHPVFHPDGRRVLANALPGREACLCVIPAPGEGAA
jgi:hypothetical protein